MRSGVALTPPATVVAASPGTSSTSMKTTNDTTSITGMRLRRRRAIIPSIGSDPLNLAARRAA
jgi:hypothetical protein